MKVKAYRNLNAGRQSPRWSIQIGGIVVATATDVTLTNVQFRVSEAGVARVRREGVRAVCAWVEGELVACTNLQTAGRNPERTANHYEALGQQPAVTGASGQRVTFNPFHTDSFLDSTGSRIDQASTVHLVNSGTCLASN